LQRWWGHAVGGLAVVAAFLLAPFVLSSYQLGLLTTALVMALFAESLSVLVQWLGLPSLGHAAHFGVGAYAVAILGALGWSGGGAGGAAGVGGLAGLCVALLLGPLALRARGGYFLLATLALAQVLWGIAMKWIALTGGEHGLVVAGWEGRGAQSTSTYYGIAGVVFGVTLCLWWLLGSDFGRVLVGIRENETRMAVLGWNVDGYRFAAFVLAGAGAGVAGGLHALHNGFVSPSDLSIATSAEVLFMVLLGEQLAARGVGQFVSPVLGALLVVLLKHVVSSYTERWQMVMGLAFMGVLALRGGGRKRWERSAIERS
jgi:branched-chain amino acid transport system permease protein